MQERVQARARLGDDVPAEHGEVVGPGITRGDHRGGALERHQLVGRDANGRPVGKHVRMQVDQPGHDELAVGIQHAAGPRHGNVRIDCLDEAEADPHVAPGAQVLARVEHLAALDHQVELVGGPVAARSGRGTRRLDADVTAKEPADRRNPRRESSVIPPTSLEDLACETVRSGRHQIGRRSRSGPSARTTRMMPGRRNAAPVTGARSRSSHGSRGGPGPACGGRTRPEGSVYRRGGEFARRGVTMTDPERIDPSRTALIA